MSIYCLFLRGWRHSLGGTTSCSLVSWGAGTQDVRFHELLMCASSYIHSDGRTVDPLFRRHRQNRLEQLFPQRTGDIYGSYKPKCRVGHQSPCMEHLRSRLQPSATLIRGYSIQQMLCIVLLYSAFRLSMICPIGSVETRGYRIS